MFKRIFWIGAGVVVGVVVASKAQAYVRANTPQKAREFILGQDQDDVAQRTLSGLFQQYQQVMHAREAELNEHYARRFDENRHS